ncbi:hypothetical protein [uncultured Cetobacterium sp.]|uniref:hypothetical protein n=1 Tax=uncultured Cetobacterium sp. TaxID=527638 RepID=UPI00261CF048|nr:hypothetical protein [uncultured Cetobacterium sp.]
MRGIKNIFKLIIMLLLNTFSYGFKINDLNFNEKISRGESQTKEFILTNNDINSKIYRILIEGDEDVKVMPNILTIDYLSSKKIKIKVDANKSKGDYSYFLVIKEIEKQLKEQGVGINKIVKIKQSYQIIE